jgi:hypothetical protein
MTVFEAVTALCFFVAGVITVALGLASAWSGYPWHALAFSAGGAYVVLWSAVRLRAAAE